VPDDLVQSIEIACSAEQAWHAITATGLQRAMMDTVLDTTLEPGAPIFYRNRNGKVIHIVGRIVTVDPPLTFAHTFRLTDRTDPPTLVTWSLEPLSENRVRVTITHSGWPQDTIKLGNVDRTWARMLANWKAVLETGDVAASTRLLYLVMGRFAFALPKRMRNENVAPEPAQP
jgi:uncharacterized protein YndB with AHSA1/START domain